MTALYRLIPALLLIAVLAVPRAAVAETLRILAVGASNTNGKGVAKSSAWPAQVQAMLNAQGYNARVSVNAVNGSTTSHMRGRLKPALAVKPQVVILSIPLTNDRRRKVNTAGNVSAMKSVLEGRGIKVVVMDRPHLWGGHQLQKDGIHFTAAGHRTVASKLTSVITGLVGPPKS